MRYFSETKEDTVGDFNGRESEAVAIIDTILEKIEAMIDANYGNLKPDVVNAGEIQNEVWEHVCDYSEEMSETEEDYQKTADIIYPGVVLRVWKKEGFREIKIWKEE